MSNKHGGLGGQGLGALFGGNAHVAAGAAVPEKDRVQELAVADIRANRYQPRKDFDELQSLLLRTVNRLIDNGNGQQLPEPVLTAKGDFVDEALKYDAAGVIQLTVHALIFNVGGFFAAAGLNLPAELTGKPTSR